MKARPSPRPGRGPRVFRDPGALLVLVGAIVLYSFFYPIPYLPQVLREVPVAVVDQDRTPLSRQLVRMADAHSLLRVAERPVSLAEAESLVLAGRVGGVLVVPAGFERDVQRGMKARVGVFADASYFLVYRQVATGFLETVGTLSAGIDIRRLEARGRTEAAARALRDPVPLLVRPLFNPTEGYASYVVPAVLVLILQQTLLIGIGLLGGTGAAERRGPAPVSSRGAPSESGDEGSAGPRGFLGTRPPTSLGMTRLLGRALFYLALYSVYSRPRLHGRLPPLRLPRAQPRPRPRRSSPFPSCSPASSSRWPWAPLFTRRETAMQVLLFTSLPSVFLAGFAWPARGGAVLAAGGCRFSSRARAASPASCASRRWARELRHVRFEWLVLWALAGAYFLLAWLAERRCGRAGRRPGYAPFPADNRPMSAPRGPPRRLGGASRVRRAARRARARRPALLEAAEAAPRGRPGAGRALAPLPRRDAAAARSCRRSARADARHRWAEAAFAAIRASRYTLGDDARAARARAPRRARSSGVARRRARPRWSYEAVARRLERTAAVLLRAQRGRPRVRDPLRERPRRRLRRPRLPRARHPGHAPQPRHRPRRPRLHPRARCASTSSWSETRRAARAGSSARRARPRARVLRARPAAPAAGRGARRGSPRRWRALAPGAGRSARSRAARRRPSTSPRP